MILHRRALSIGLSLCAALFLTGLAVACTSTTPEPIASPSPGASASNLLKIYTLPDQFAPEALAAFEQESGVKVVLTTYTHEVELLKTLEAGPIDFDLVLVNSYLIPALRAQNLLAPLDKDALSNMQHLRPEFENPHADPGNRHCVPYQWGLIGIGYDSTTVESAMVSWNDLLSHTQALRLALPDSPRITLGAVLLASGNSPNTIEKAKLEQAKAMLLAYGHPISYSVSPAQQLLDGSADVVVDRLGTLMMASQKNPALKYSLPREGTLRWASYLCLMKDTPNTVYATQLINQLFNPQVGLASVRFTGQSSPNRDVIALLPPAEQADPLKYPASAGAQSRQLFILADLEPQALDLYDQTWNALQAAH